MNATTLAARLTSWLAELSPAADMLGKVSLVLLLAWLIHFALARAYPRWRVVLWRGALVGVMLAAVIPWLGTFARLPLAPPREFAQPETQSPVDDAPPSSVGAVQDSAALAFTPSASTSSDNAYVPPLADSAQELASASSTIGESSQAQASSDEDSAAAVASDLLQPSVEQPARPIAVGEPAASLSWWPSLTLVALLLWLTGITLTALRSFVGSRRVQRLIAAAAPVPREIVTELDRLAESFGRLPKMTVKQSQQLSTPCLTGLFAPVLLLPAQMCTNGRHGDLRAVFAHELCHVCSRDLIWNRVLHWLSALLWFHPLAWYVRRAHTAACDAACDARSAQLLGDVSGYSRTLARIALQSVSTQALPGLAMAREADVTRRLAVLQRNARRTAPLRSKLAGLAAAVVLLAAGIGGLEITHAEPAIVSTAATFAEPAAQPPATIATPAEPASSSTSELVAFNDAEKEPTAETTQAASESKPRTAARVRTLDADSGAPLSDVMVQFSVRLKSRTIRLARKTDAEGRCEFVLPPATTFDGVSCSATPDGYVPATFAFKDLDPAADEATLKFEKMTASSPGVRIHAVEAATGKPLAKVSIEFRGAWDGGTVRTTRDTDADGWCVLPLPADANVTYVSAEGKPAGFVPVYGRWDDDQHPVELPIEYTMQFHPGTTIGGVVRNAAGEPVAGTRIEIMARATRYEDANFYFHMDAMTTGADGRWQSTVAPADLTGVSVRAEHNDYLSAGLSSPKHEQALRDQTATITLSQGPSVSGRVLDSDGKPIAGATAAFGSDRWGSSDPKTTTDAEGRFHLKNCSQTTSIVTAQANGYAPEFQMVDPRQPGASLEFRLQSGHTIRGRVVDAQGNPVAGAFVAADTWRGHRSIDFRVDTDNEGRFEWHSAPADTVLFDFGKNGYMATRRYPLTALEDEQLVRLRDILIIEGSVFDDLTGQPIPEFHLVKGVQFPGNNRVYWNAGEQVVFRGGRYTYMLDEPSGNLYLRAEAAGYLPVESRAFGIDEGRQTFDFRLQPGTGPQGVVLLPNGQPASGADVILVTAETGLQLSAGRFDGRGNTVATRTDERGRFAFNPQSVPFAVVALHDGGYAKVSSKDLEASGEVRLAAWARVEGKLLIGAEPGADQNITYSPFSNGDDGIHIFSYGYDTTTDAEGRFRFERVIPGPGRLSRVVVTALYQSWLNTPTHSKQISIEPGQAAEVVIGGTGRPVVGRVALPDGIPVDFLWSQNEPGRLTSKPATPDGHEVWYAFPVQSDGTFRVDDVPAGEFKLHLSLNAPANPAQCGTGAAIGRAELAVVVPEIPGGRSDEPLDVGTLEPTLFDTLDIGESAPEFTVRTFDNQTLRLSDLRGKIVLLDFWAQWCGPCLAEMPNLKEIHEEFGDNERFALVSLFLDDNVEEATKYCQNGGFDWIQAVGGPSTSCDIANRYRIRAIPATFLVGPDGTVIGAGLRGKDLRNAVEQALANNALFDGLDTSSLEPRSRFGLTSFAAADAAVSPDASVAAVVLDDSDPDFSREARHTDGLRLLAATDGSSAEVRELKSIAEFNNAQSVGAHHAVVIDAGRGRIYMCENVANRITAFDSEGSRLFQIADVKARALAVRPETGQLWCSTGDRLDDGEVVVFDLDGHEVTTFAVPGVDIAYDPHSDAFWLVGYRITKVSRSGKILFERPSLGWCCVSVATNPLDGSVWIAERQHPQIPGSRNVVWHLDAAGKVLHELNLSEANPVAVAFDVKTQTAFVADSQKSVLRIDKDGKFLEPLPIAAFAVAVSPTTGNVWATTKNEVLQLSPAGEVVGRFTFPRPSDQSWIAAF